MGYIKNGMVLVPVPIGLLKKMGLEPLDVIRMRVANGKLILEKEVEDGFSCDGDCEHWFLRCWGNADVSPSLMKSAAVSGSTVTIF